MRKEAFLFHCALGCRIGDFQRFTMDNVGVSEEGIPYIHYLPNSIFQSVRKSLTERTESVIMRLIPLSEQLAHSISLR